MDIKEVKRLQKEAAKRRAKEKKEKELGEFASYEELYFSWYLDDLIKHGYVSKYELQPPAHVIFPRITIAWMEEMKTKLKINEHPVLQEGTYTTDFKIHWTKKALGVFCNGGASKRRPYFMGVQSHDFLEEYETEVDVKGDNTSANVRGNHSMITFPLKQKMLYTAKGIYAQKVIPVKLFNDTFVPTRYFFTDGGKSTRTLTGIKKPLTITEYVKQHTSFKKK